MGDATFCCCLQKAQYSRGYPIMTSRSPVAYSSKGLPPIRVLRVSTAYSLR